MWQFHHFSIFNKIIIIIILILSGYALTQSLFISYQINEDFLVQKNRILTDKKNEITEKMNMVYKLAMQIYQQKSKIENIERVYHEKLKSIIEIVNNSLEYQYNTLKKEGVADAIIQERLKDYLRHLRYEGDTGYIFTYNLQGVIISHADTSLENQYFLDKKDATGKYFAREFMEIAKSPATEGLSHYHWRKLGQEEPQLKVSYIKLFKPYQWVIGTGVYVEDWLPPLKLEIAKLITFYKYDVGNTKNNYFFVLDEQGITVSNGGFPDLNDKSVINFQDSQGVFFVQDMIRTAKESLEKNGFVSYIWPHPTTHKELYKLTYVQWFEPFRWVIATGIYLNDLGIEEIQLELEQKTYNIIQRIILSGTVFLVLGIFMSVSLVKMMTKPLILARNAAEEIAKGHFSQEVPYAAQDEIGQLVTTLNFMSKQLQLSFDKLNDKNKELIALNQEKNEFLGIAAHDLKNPLSGFLGLADLILDVDGNITKEELLDYAKLLQTGSSNMFQLITNLLDVNAIESGKININLQQIEPPQLIAEIIQNYTERAHRKNIIIHFDIQSDSHILTDAQIARQILDNLISNAIKYSPLGKNIYIRLYQTETNICCGIQDEGFGLSEADQQKLFIKFTRLATKPTGDEHSTGLGLFIVKKLADAIKAHVRCYSELGHGTTFTVEFSKKLPVQAQQIVG